MVARASFVSLDGSRYRVHWQWVSVIVRLAKRVGALEVWSGDQRLAVHPGALSAGQYFTMPGQWAGLPRGMAGHLGKRWRCRSPLSRWNGAPWRSTS